MSKLLDAIKKPFIIKRLKREYRTLYGSTSSDANQSLQRQMAYIKTKQPNQSDEWYLKKIIYDLEHDRRKQNKINWLKKEYMMLYGSTSRGAERSLQRQMVDIKTKQPNQSEEWYLRKIIYDLEHDRRRQR